MLSRNRQRLAGRTEEGKTFENEDLRGAIAHSSVWSNCVFRGTRFGQADLGNATFLDCRFEGCDFSQAILIARIYRTSFTNCVFDQANLAGADIMDSRFKECRLQYASLHRATALHSDFRSCDFHGATLSFAETVSCDFTDSSLWGAVIPLSCAFWVGNTFDRKQAEYLLALFSYTNGNATLVARLQDEIRPTIRKAVMRLVGQYTADPAQCEAVASNPEGNDPVQGRLPGFDLVAGDPAIGGDGHEPPERSDA